MKIKFLTIEMRPHRFENNTTEIRFEVVTGQNKKCMSTVIIEDDDFISFFDRFFYELKEQIKRELGLNEE